MPHQYYWVKMNGHAKLLTSTQSQPLKQNINIRKGARDVSYFPFKDSKEVIDLAELQERSIFCLILWHATGKKRIRVYFSVISHKSIDTIYIYVNHTIKCLSNCWEIIPLYCFVEMRSVCCTSPRNIFHAIWRMRDLGNYNWNIVLGWSLLIHGLFSES